MQPQQLPLVHSVHCAAGARLEPTDFKLRQPLESTVCSDSTGWYSWQPVRGRGGSGTVSRLSFINLCAVSVDVLAAYRVRVTVLDYTEALGAVYTSHTLTLLTVPLLLLH